MKKTMYAALIFAAFGMTACGEQEVEETAVEEVQAPVSYALNAAESELEWRGSWVVPTDDGGMQEAKDHTGKVAIKSGDVTVDGDNISGTFMVDMNTIEVTDLEEEDGKGKLEGHLRAEDFFNVGEYANVSVALNGIENGVADLAITVMGITLNEKAPVETKMEGDKMMMHGEFTVDFAALEMPMTQGNPEKPEDGKVNSAIDFHLHVVMDKK